MGQLYSIGQAAEILGVSIDTLRNWEKQGKLIPVRTQGGHRRYRSIDLGIQPQSASKLTICYARVSSQDQKPDLERQALVLASYCEQQGWIPYEIIKDIGSGMNYRKKGLKRLLNILFESNIVRLVITDKDRLLRFGSELIFAICERQQVQVTILNQSPESSFEEDLAKDVLEIITVFSARLYGARSKRNQKILENLVKSLDSSEKLG